MATESAIRRIAWSKWLLLLLIVGVIGGAYVWWVNQPRGPDMTEVFKANLRGAGWMDQFQYTKAQQSFEEVVRLAPEWLPGHINLAIAIFNHNQPEPIEEAKKILRQVLKKDSKNLHAQYCLGILAFNAGLFDEARPFFDAVYQADPNDSNVAYFRGMVEQTDPVKQLDYFTRALELDPYHGGALHQMSQLMMRKDEATGRELIAIKERLENNKWLSLSKIIYTGMGKYAEIVGVESQKTKTPLGPLPVFEKSQDLKVILSEGARWAKGDDFGQGVVGDLYRAVRKRFGAVITVLDIDQDGKPDLFLPGAVLENGKVRDLLLHNEGSGVLRDVTRLWGLADHPASWGAWAADYDNDTLPDLLLTGPYHPRLFRNLPKNTKPRAFQDVTKVAGLDGVSHVCFGAALIDLDQDGDLDILLAQFRGSREEALQGLAGSGANTGNGIAVFLNIGEAKPASEKEYFDLTTKFKAWTQSPPLSASNLSIINLAVTDADRDHDIDILAIRDRSDLAVVLNDRLLRFQSGLAKLDALRSGTWNGALALDSRQRGCSDLFIVGPGAKPVFMLNSNIPPREELTKRFSQGITNSPPLLQAYAADLDLDGMTDIVALSEERRPVLLHNDGERLVLIPNGLGSDGAWPKDGLAVTVTDLDGDFYPDVILWSEAEGLQWLRNRGNGNKGIKVALTGRRGTDKELRCNSDGVGVRIRIHAESLVTGGEVATVFAGLGQSHQPFLFGMGKHETADIVRLRWPDGVWQGELSQPAGQVAKIHQTDRMPISCPLLFTWDGEKYVFVCDFLGGGAIGEVLPDESHRPPWPEESVKIESRQLKAKDGKYILKLAEPMDEVTYLDKLQLVVVDHPPAVRVYPEERMASAAASQDLHGYLEDEQVHPVSARDHKGRDVTKTLRHWDRNMVDGFAKRSWLGYAEDHFVQLDFGEQLAKYGPQDRLFLCLAGWTDYPYPEAMWAANQAGIALTPPVLERQKTDGAWETIVPDVGFPAGGSRMMMTEITGKVIGPKCVLRLKTNMRTYWDQVFVAPIKESAACKTVATGLHQGKLFRTTTLAVNKAELTAGHVMQEYSPDGKQPNLYDFHKHQSAPLTRLAGKLTRFGDVTELLQADDDRFVIFGAGDELTVVFAADKLPDPPKGWTRSFVLRTAGYCKGAAPFTATGETIEPLPFRAMSNFPYSGAERYPQTPLHQEYLRKYQTRQVGGD